MFFFGCRVPGSRLREVQEEGLLRFRDPISVKVAKCTSYKQIIVSLKQIEYGFGYIIVRSPYTSYSIYLRGAIYLCPRMATIAASTKSCPFFFGRIFSKLRVGFQIYFGLGPHPLMLVC